MVTRLLSTLLLGLAFLQPAAEPTWVVVVHPETEVASISQSELSKIFLKRLRSWASGEPARPVDQSPGSLVRARFSRAVHGRSVVNIELYWKRMIFSGRAVPPPERSGDQAVLDYVRRNPGAVGYVAAGQSLDGVRQMMVEP